MKDATLTKLRWLSSDEAPVFAAMVAGGLYTLEWYIGSRLPAELVGVYDWLAIGGGLAAIWALEGMLVQTAKAIKAGRGSLWSYVAICVAGSFSAAVALDHYGAFGEGLKAGRWLHAAFALSLIAYLLHWSNPGGLGVQLEQAKADLEQTKAKLEQAEQDLVSVLADKSRMATALEQAKAEAEQAKAEPVNQPEPIDQRAALRLAKRLTDFTSLREVADLAEVAHTTLAYRLKKLEKAS